MPTLASWVDLGGQLDGSAMQLATVDPGMPQASRSRWNHPTYPIYIPSISPKDSTSLYTWVMSIYTIYNHTYIDIIYIYMILYVYIYMLNIVKYPLAPKELPRRPSPSAACANCWTAFGAEKPRCSERPRASWRRRHLGRAPWGVTMEFSSMKQD